MLLRSSIPTFVFLLSIAASTVHAQKSCDEVFRTSVSVRKDAMQVEPVLAQKILQFLKLLGAGDTTSLRQEDKFVLNATTIDQTLSVLKQKHGDAFQLRDAKEEGRKNITGTQYALPFVWQTQQGKNISAKIRFRKYFEADSSVPLEKATLTPAPFVKEHQFVEMKIDHPLYEQVVIKPRMLVKDSDAAMMQDQVLFLQKKVEIEQRAIALNPKVSPEVIHQFFDIMTEVYSQNAIGTLPLFAKTFYVRDSYSLMLKDSAGKNVEVQFTVDREINVTDSRNMQVVRAYGPEDIVLEMKTPLAYAGLTSADLQSVPGLATVAQLKAYMTENQNPKFPVGSGKLSTFKGAAKELESKMRELIAD